MSYSEFPHTNYSDHDHVELILLYKKLVAEYEGTLEEITEVSNRLDKYEADMDARILNIENVIVPQAVNRAVQDAMYSYQQEVNTRFNNMNNRLSTIENMYDSIQVDLQELNDSFTAQLSAVRQELLGKVSDLQAQINNFNNQVTNLAKKIDEFEKNTISEMDLFKEQVMKENDSFIEEVNKEVTKFEENIDNWLKVLRADYTLRDDEVLSSANKYTDVKVSALHTLIESLNLASNEKEVRWVWQYGCCFGGYNAIQWYNEAPITCEDWNKSGITCVDWYVRGREVFGWFDRRKFMFSPVSGRYVDVRVALLELASALKINGLTAGDYEKLGFTAEEYDSFQKTAGEYDWNGKELLKHVQ